MSMENCNDIGNRTRDLPACSAVPQSTASPSGDIAIFDGLTCRQLNFSGIPFPPLLYSIAYYIVV